jgi:hypothetical protein
MGWVGVCGYQGIGRSGQLGESICTEGRIIFVPEKQVPKLVVQIYFI